MQKINFSRHDKVCAENLQKLWGEMSSSNGVTQADFCKMAGWKNHSSFGDFINARRPMSDATKRRIAGAMGVSVSEIDPMLKDGCLEPSELTREEQRLVEYFRLVDSSSRTMVMVIVRYIANGKRMRRIRRAVKR